MSEQFGAVTGLTVLTAIRNIRNSIAILADLVRGGVQITADEKKEFDRMMADCAAGLGYDWSQNVAVLPDVDIKASMEKAVQATDQSWKTRSTPPIRTAVENDERLPNVAD